MKAAGLLIGTIALLASLAIACGGDSDSAEPGNSGNGAAGITPAQGGMIAPGQYLTFDGERYELVNLFFADPATDKFTPIGEVTQSDVDLAGDSRVFERSGESGSVYTYNPATVEDPAYWLAWRLVS